MRVGGALPLSFCGDAPNHEALAAALNVMGIERIPGPNRQVKATPWEVPAGPAGMVPVA